MFTPSLCVQQQRNLARGARKFISDRHALFLVPFLSQSLEEHADTNANEKAIVLAPLVVMRVYVCTDTFETCKDAVLFHRTLPRVYVETGHVLLHSHVSVCLHVHDHEDRHVHGRLMQGCREERWACVCVSSAFSQADTDVEK